MRVGKTYKRNDSLSDARYLCTGITTTGNAVALIKYINPTRTKEFESIIFKKSFSKYEEVKNSGKIILVVGKFKDFNRIDSFCFTSMEDYKEWKKHSSNFTRFAVKEIEWEEGEGLQNEMFKNNLVAIAGLEIKEKTFLLFMFETYNRPLRSPSSYFDQYRNRKDGFFLVDGDLENPFFSWPVFLKIKTKKQ